MTRGLGDLALALALLAFAPGCDQDEDLGYAPDDCRRVKPETGFLLVHCTVENPHRRVPLEIYRGTLEKGYVVLSDTLDTMDAEYEMPVGAQYTAVAHYFVPPDTVLVVDAARLVVDSREYEDATCYYVKTRELDLRLRE